MYSKTVLDHFEHPRNAGKPQEFNVTGISGDPNAGPFMVLYLNVVHRVIASTGFQTFGCGPAIAAGSVLTELVKGKTVEDASGIDTAFLLAQLGGLPLGKGHCAQIAIEALNRALNEAAKLEKERGEARSGD